MKHKLTVFKRGNLLNCYLDLPLDECKNRDAVMQQQKSEIQLKQEEKHMLTIQEFEFDDHFEFWFNLGDDLQEIQNICLNKALRETDD